MTAGFKHCPRLIPDDILRERGEPQAEGFQEVELEGIGPSAARPQKAPDVSRPSPKKKTSQRFNRTPVVSLAFCFHAHADTIT